MMRQAIQSNSVKCYWFYIYRAVAFQNGTVYFIHRVNYFASSNKMQQRHLLTRAWIQRNRKSRRRRFKRSHMLQRNAKVFRRKLSISSQRICCLGVLICWLIYLILCTQCMIWLLLWQTEMERNGRIMYWRPFVKRWVPNCWPFQTRTCYRSLAKGQRMWSCYSSTWIYSNMVLYEYCF